MTFGVVDREDEGLAMSNHWKMWGWAYLLGGMIYLIVAASIAASKLPQ
jgi:hypothetical protein